MGLKRALKEILKFEILYKLITLGAVNPFLNEIYQTYVSSRGVAFNVNILSSFLQIKGLIIFIGLIICSMYIVFYELCVIVNLIAFSKTGKDFTLRSVLKSSFWNLKIMRGITIVPSIFYYILLLPLVGIGYLNTLVPSIEIPWFIFGEMQRTQIGRIGIYGIHFLYFGLYLMMLFLPLYMVLKQKTFGTAFKSSLLCYKKISWKSRFTLSTCILIWIILRRNITINWFRNILENKDFDFYFFKYLLQSEAFRKDLLFWIFVTLVITIFMILFLYILFGVFQRAEGTEVDVCPAWSGDAGTVVSIFAKHIKKWFVRQKTRLKKKRYQFLCVCILAAITVSIAANIQMVPLIHAPLVIGHRGCTYGIENTIDAVEKADTYKVDYSEIDVQLSKDGVPVVVHDSNLWRLAGKAVDVTSLTLSQLKELNIQAFTHPGETSTIPTLAEMIQTAKESPNQSGLLIELKPKKGESEKLANAVMKLVEQYEFGEKAMFMSLDYGSVFPIQEKHPEWWVGYCIYGSSGEIDDSVWKYNMDFLAVEENQVSNRLVTQAREHWLPVYVWTVTDTDKMKQYLEMGITGLIGDVPNEVMDEVKTYTKEHPSVNYYWKKKGYPKGKEFE